MKKFLLSLAAVATLSFAASAAEATFDFTGTGDVYGLTRTSDNSATYYGDPVMDITEGGVTISLTKTPFGTFSGSGIRLWSDGLRVMKNSGFIITAGGDDITKVEITTVKANGCNSFNVNSTPNAFTLTSDNKVGTWEGAATPLAIANDGAIGLKGTVAIAKIVVTYGGQADTRKDADLAFSETSVTVELGDPFTAPTLTKATNAAVTYSSDAESVATVDATTGAVNILAVGTARITAVAEANDQYKAGSASYLITVKEKIVAPEGAVFFSPLGEGFSFDNPEGLDVWKLDSKYGLKGSAFLNSQINAAVATAYTTEAIDLTALKNITLTFKNAFNNYKLNNVMIPVTDFVGYAAVLVREEGAAEWTVVDNAITAPEAFSWTFYDNAPVSLEAYKGKKIQIGFRYFSSTEVAGTWEIQRIAVVGEADLTGIEAIEAVEAPVEYFNLQGVRVANPENGIFIRRQGNTVTKVVVR